MILIIDNYDSFTFNLVQYIGSICKNVEVIKDDEKSIEDLATKEYTHIILSPGPGRPENTQLCNEVIKTLSIKIPTLGICLGHQAIAYNFGASIEYSKYTMHGKTSVIIHNNTSKLFKGIPKRFNGTRYHSLAVSKDWSHNNINITSSKSHRCRFPRCTNLIIIQLISS